jgi:hypothetical protein
VISGEARSLGLMEEDPLAPGTESGSESVEGSDGVTAASLVEDAPVLARIAAGAAWRTASWTFDAYVQGMNWITRRVLSDEATAELLNGTRAELRDRARNLLGIDEIEERLLGGRSASEGPRQIHPLRERGFELLERSADVSVTEEAHPAYERILTQLAPDEARVLRLLATKGARPAVDVKTWRPLGIGSQTIAPGLSMIGAEAGCRYIDRVPAYLNNLFRLGLIWFSREPLDDPNLYQVLEAQPDVLEASKRAGRASTTRRSIHLTPFGIDFCETCLPLSTAELEALEARRAAEDGAEEPD